MNVSRKLKIVGVVKSLTKKTEIALAAAGCRCKEEGEG